MVAGDANVSKPLLVVAGPTASGKSQLGVQLARALQGEVVSIDSVQAYRRFDIGSAKPTVEEMGGVFHHLINIWGPDHIGDAEQFRKIAEEVLADIAGRNKQAVLVGGTNLYFKAIIYGLASLKSSSAQVRNELAVLPREVAYERLRSLDPVRAGELHPNDSVRVIRALEAIVGGAGSPSSLYSEHGFAQSKHNFLGIVLVWEREELRERISRRVKAMLAKGLVAEVVQLKREYGGALKPFETIGYKEVVEALSSHPTDQALAQTIVASTGQFAKQQLTFWRNEPGKRGWITRPREGEAAAVIRSENRRRGTKIADWPVLDLSCNELVAQVKSRLSLPFHANEVWYVDAKRCLDTIGYLDGDT